MHDFPPLVEFRHRRDATLERNNRFVRHERIAEIIHLFKIAETATRGMSDTFKEFTA